MNRFKLNLAAASDELRPNMRKIIITKKYCYATNGHILVRVPTKEALEGVTIPDGSQYVMNAVDWKRIKDAKRTIFYKNEKGEAYLMTPTKVVTKKTILSKIQTDTIPLSARVIGFNGNSVNVEAVLNGLLKTPTDVNYRIGLNAKLLNKLSSAMGLDYGLELIPKGKARGIICEDANRGTEAIGVIMPVLV